jgi:hypothetical protein
MKPDKTTEEVPSNIERILCVVSGLRNLDATQMASFTYFFLGTLMSFVRQHPGKMTDDLVNDLRSCAAMFGIQSGSYNAKALKNWIDTIQGLGEEIQGLGKEAKP